MKRQFHFTKVRYKGSGQEHESCVHELCVDQFGDGQEALVEADIMMIAPAKRIRAKAAKNGKKQAKYRQLRNPANQIINA